MGHLLHPTDPFRGRPALRRGAQRPVNRRTKLVRAVDKAYREVKNSPRPGQPIHWSEFNASYGNEVDVADIAILEVVARHDDRR